MGISEVSLRHNFNICFEEEGLRMWGTLFTTTYDGDIVLQPDEVESGNLCLWRCAKFQNLSEESWEACMECVCCAHHV